MEQSGERSRRPPLHFGVAAKEKGAFLSSSTTVGKGSLQVSVGYCRTLYLLLFRLVAGSHHVTIEIAKCNRKL